MRKKDALELIGESPMAFIHYAKCPTRTDNGDSWLWRECICDETNCLALSIMQVYEKGKKAGLREAKKVMLEAT